MSKLKAVVNNPFVRISVLLVAMITGLGMCLAALNESNRLEMEAARAEVKSKKYKMAVVSFNVEGGAVNLDGGIVQDPERFVDGSICVTVVNTGVRVCDKAPGYRLIEIKESDLGI